MCEDIKATTQDQGQSNKDIIAVTNKHDKFSVLIVSSSRGFKANKYSILMGFNISTQVRIIFVMKEHLYPARMLHKYHLFGR